MPREVPPRLAVQHADEEYGFSGVHPLKAVGSWSLAVKTSADLPGEPQHAVDGDGQAALDAGMAVPVRVLAQDAGDDADAENNEGEADEALGPVVQAFRQSEVELQDGNAESGDGEGVAQCIGHA